LQDGSVDKIIENIVDLSSRISICLIAICIFLFYTLSAFILGPAFGLETNILFFGGLICLMSASFVYASSIFKKHEYVKDLFRISVSRFKIRYTLLFVVTMILLSSLEDFISFIDGFKILLCILILSAIYLLWLFLGLAIFYFIMVRAISSS
jgi:hypothetical protein